MNIADAIEALKRIQAKHGNEAPVLFDCPHCRQSFPLGVAKVAVVIESAPAPPARATEKER